MLESYEDLVELGVINFGHFFIWRGSTPNGRRLGSPRNILPARNQHMKYEAS